jgi:uncharacterized membrane protein YfcA
MFDYSFLRLFSGIIVGFIAGFLGGLLGITGSVIILPLVILFGIFSSYRLAIGTVLFGFDPFQSIFAVIEYAKQKKIDYLIGIVLYVFYFLGSYTGAKFNKRFNEITLKYITATILLMLSLYMFYSATNHN